ncbi:MAG TPA: hypothetical protein VGR37_06640 [Longimicrobiaceae bacterium]|nr:hypothetical protein [Longimicrobiaceae bacterium]
MEALLQIAEPWASLYNDSPPLQTVVLFAHLAGMLLGGGFALAADRATLLASHAGFMERERQLSELGMTHRPVEAGLAVTLASGLLMLAADLETYLVSVVFWTKMGLIVLLLVNGYLLQRTGKVLSQDPGGAWDRLRTAAVVSIALWLAVLLAGTWLASMS